MPVFCHFWLFLCMEMCIFALNPNFFNFNSNKICVHGHYCLLSWIGCPSELTQPDLIYEKVKGSSHHSGSIHDLRRESFCQ